MTLFIEGCIFILSDGELMALNVIQSPKKRSPVAAGLQQSIIEQTQSTVTIVNLLPRRGNRKEALWLPQINM